MLYEKKKTKMYSLDEAIEKHVGKIGSQERDQFETELKLEAISVLIKKVRKARNLTQEELGELVGVQKFQISRLENNAGNVTMDTVIKVFNALHAKLLLTVKLEDEQEEELELV